MRLRSRALKEFSAPSFERVDYGKGHPALQRDGGVAKSALETSFGQLVNDVGRQDIRVKAISADPIKTLAASGNCDFHFILKWSERSVPLRRNVTIEDVGGGALHLLSDLSAGVSGETHHVDAGYHAICMSGKTPPDVALSQLGFIQASRSIASPALARDGAWYVELDGGPMIVEDIEFDLPAATNAVHVDHHKGYDFGGVVGYDFGSVRLEAEGSYRSANIQDLQIGAAGIANGASSSSRAANTTLPADGDSSVLSFMVNALADFGADDGIQGFVGGGVGVARTKFDGVT